MNKMPMKPSVVGRLEKKNIRYSFYTESLITEAFRVNLIDRSERERLKTELAEILRKNIERYTSSSSFSVSQDQADDMIQSVLYAIDVYLLTLSSDTGALELLRTVPLETLYYRGIRLLRSYVFKSAGLFVRVKNARSAVSCETYAETLDIKIRSMLSRYDLFYSAHKIPAIPPYQTVLMPAKLRGILFLIRYLQNLYAESLFCLRFDEADLDAVYKKRPSKEENFFFPALIVSIAHAIGDGEVDSLAQDDAALKRASSVVKRLSEAERRRLISEKAAEIVSDDPPFLRSYVTRCAEKYGKVISDAIRSGNPSEVTYVAKQ